jgi:hypothetical protein
MGTMAQMRASSPSTAEASGNASGEAAELPRPRVHKDEWGVGCRGVHQRGCNYMHEHRQSGWSRAQSHTAKHTPTPPFPKTIGQDIQQRWALCFKQHNHPAVDAGHTMTLPRVGGRGRAPAPSRARSDTLSKRYTTCTHHRVPGRGKHGGELQTHVRAPDSTGVKESPQPLSTPPDPKAHSPQTAHYAWYTHRAHRSGAGEGRA